MGELRLWSEPGPFATLVAVIRGNPPEGLHDTLVNVVSRIHAERHHALEAFDGDSSGLADVEAELSEVVALRQRAPARKRSVVRWLVAPIALALLLAGESGASNARATTAFGTTTFSASAATRHRDHRGRVGATANFRLPAYATRSLSIHMRVLNEAEIDPSRVLNVGPLSKDFDPSIVLRRLTESLSPPPGVTVAIEGGRSSPGIGAIRLA